MLELEPNKQICLKPPMKYPGNKYDSLPHILGRLPYMDVFVDVFGGSASVLLGRKPHGLEVYNDRFSGVVDFYRCIRDHLIPLTERLELIIHSREEWEWCKEHWADPDPTTVEGRIERAARWYYMVSYSFGGIDRGWARTVKKGGAVSEVLRNKLPLFATLHARLRKVQIENQEWYDCMLDYDSDSTVFYLDPPYFEQDNAHYKHIVNHEAMLERIFKTKGFVALSGYPTPMYEKYNWTDRIEWKRQNKLQYREEITEVLWIKE
jgi:DNA adenine methylase